MPAGSDGSAVEVPQLPRTWRPFGPRMAAAAFAVLLLGSFAFLWLRFPDDVKESITPFQRITTIVILLGAIALMYSLARSRVVATEAGLRVTNGYRSREFPWADLVAVRFPQGAPWPKLQYRIPNDDDEFCSLMGIQGSDGQRAKQAVVELRALISERAHPSSH